MTVQLARRGRDNEGRGRPRSKQAEDAILNATVEILGERGLRGLTIEEVVARAGGGKATVYRRWSSKLPLVIAAITTLPELEVPDTGTVRGDLRHLLLQLASLLCSSPLGRVLPHLLVEQIPDRETHEAVDRFLETRRMPIYQVLRRGMERGEIPPECALPVLQHLIIGPLINCFFFTREPITASFVDVVIRTVLDGLAAAPTIPSGVSGRAAPG
jgi:AcrR family transcriptional regulator